MRLFLLTLMAAAAASSCASAQVKLPPAPETYDVEFRYRIKAGRNERIAQFDEMMKYLDRLGFKRKPAEDSDLDIFDPDAERMTGIIPAAGARQIPLEPHVQTVLLAPTGYQPPGDGRVKVLIELNSGFTPPLQRSFSNQVKDVLASYGFQEAAAYDHRGYTVLRGTIQALKAYALLSDLRTQPSGWFLPLIHEKDRPELFNSKLPIRLVELLPEEGAPAPVAAQAPLPPAPPEQPELAKLSAALRRRLETLKEGEGIRVEATLDVAPADIDNSWKEPIILTNPGTAIEGLIGRTVTLTVRSPDQVLRLTRLPSIISIRLPRSATLPPSTPAKEESPPKEEPKAALSLTGGGDSAADLVLKETGLDRLHAQGKRGTGLRVAIIDTDFNGWEKFVGKGLPATTHFVDLTAERNSDIRPEPRTQADNAIGHGTQCALAVRFAAPDADIVLVRVSAEAPYQLITVFRYTQGDYFQPQSFRIRREELEIDAGALRAERITANEQYRKAFDDFEDDEPARERRRNARLALAEIAQRERALTARAERILKLEKDLIALGGSKVILNTLSWNSGYALDASSMLSRFLDRKMTVGRPNPAINSARAPQPSLWFQPAGDTRGQAWLNPFRDSDDNGLMEFAPPDVPLPPGRWTRELNFLGFRPETGPDLPDLPAETRLRVTIQWREAHDPDVAEIEYRFPLAPLNLALLRQRDANAQKLPSDEMELIARSEGNPEALVLEPEFGVYEQTIELSLPAAGRYALQVEGKQPLGLRPGGALNIREQEIHWQLKPRIFVEVVDAATRAKGRAVFADYETFFGGLAVPADARSVVAVGAMRIDRVAESFSAIGGGLVSELLIKPNVMTYCQLPKLGDGSSPARGSALSAALATGIGACLLSGGAESANFLDYLRIPPGGIFVVPTDWIRK